MKKKVVHVTYDMGIGGAERVILNLIENTDRRKFDVSILCLDRPIGSFGMQLQKEGYNIINLARKPGFDVSLIRKIHSLIRSHNVGVLHCHQYTPYVYGLLAAILTKTKVIYTEHGRFYPDRRKLKRMMINPFLNMFTDCITAISAATREALVKNENFPRNRISVVYNGLNDSHYTNPVNGELRSALGLSPKATVLGTVARFDAIKNHVMMIKALKIIHEYFPETYLLLVGDGPERHRLQALTADLRLTSKIIFTGLQNEPQNYYKLMDVFLLTSFSEGTAMTLLEAMASGLPCVVTDVGGNPEIVENGQTGFVIPSNNEEALAKKICMLLRNVNLMKSMGRAGRDRIKSNFTVHNMVQSYETIYDSV